MTNTMCLTTYTMLLTEKQIINNWSNILSDPYYPYPEIKDPQAFIEKIKAGGVVIGGADVSLIEPFAVERRLR